MEQALQHPWLNADCCKQHDIVDNVTMNQVILESIKAYANYSKLKKLALMAVAYKSTPNEIGSLRRAFEKFGILRNGTVCLDEFREVMRMYDYSAEEIECLFAASDLGGSGLVHYVHRVPGSSD